MVEKGNCNNLNFKYSFADITFHLFYPQGVWRNLLLGITEEILWNSSLVLSTCTVFEYSEAGFN